MNIKFITKILVLVVMLSSQSYGFWGSKKETLNLPEKFQNSLVITPMGMNGFPFGKITVNQLSKIIESFQMANGKYLELDGWTNSDNEYTLKVIGKEIIYLKFVHMLNKQFNGDGSYMTFIVKGKEHPGKGFMTILERAGLIKY